MSKASLSVNELQDIIASGERKLQSKAEELFFKKEEVRELTASVKGIEAELDHLKAELREREAV